MNRLISRRVIGILLDVGVVCLVLAVRWAALVRGAPDAALEGVGELPQWWWKYGSIHDWVLVGPDAGNWAANAQAWMDGDKLDPHRLPVYTIATAWMGGVFGDVVVGGHMVNHLVSALSCVLAYLVGRATSGRVVGIGVALLCAMSPELVNNQVFYGVDPMLQFVPLLMGLACWSALSGHRWAAVAVGAASGLALGTHFFAIFFPPVALGLLLFTPGRWRSRLLSLVGAVLLMALAWKVLLWRYSGVDLGFVTSIYTAGVGGTPDRGSGEPLGLSGSIGLVASRLGSAPGLALQRGLRSMKVEGVPWLGLLALFWVGVVGFGIRGVGRRQSTWRSGLLLIAFLLPLIPLEASRAPDRYALYSRPFFYALVLRGAYSTGYALVFGASRIAKAKLPQALYRVCGVLPVLLLVVGYKAPYTERWNLYPPIEEGLHARAVAAAVVENFDKARSVATTSQSIPFHSGLPSCPRSPCAPGEGAALQSCLETLAYECAGEGRIPYLLRRSRTAGVGDAPNPHLEAWVQEHGALVDSIPSRDGAVEVWGLERGALLAGKSVVGGSAGDPQRLPSESP